MSIEEFEIGERAANYLIAAIAMIERSPQYEEEDHKRPFQKTGRLAFRLGAGRAVATLKPVPHYRSIEQFEDAQGVGRKSPVLDLKDAYTQRILDRFNAIDALADARRIQARDTAWTGPSICSMRIEDD